MTISNTTTRNDDIGNGAQNAFAFTFPIETSADVAVWVAHPTTYVETELTITTDYTVALAASGNGGTVTLVNAAQAWMTAGFLTDQWAIVIKRKQAQVQATDIRNLERLRLDEIENQLDRVVKMCQMLAAAMASCIKTPEIEPPLVDRTKLPARQVSGGMVIGFNSSGSAIEMYSAVNALGGPITAQYIVLALNSQLPNERRLVGTADQVILTDGGAGGDLTLSAPQSLAPSSSPQFTGVTISSWLANPFLTLGQITSDQNDYAAGGAARISSDAPRAITGVQGGANGRRMLLMNVGAFTITLRNQNAGSSAANRIITGTGADFGLVADQMVELVYDATVSRWRMLKNA